MAVDGPPQEGITEHQSSHHQGTSAEVLRPDTRYSSPMRCLQNRRSRSPSSRRASLLSMSAKPLRTQNGDTQRELLAIVHGMERLRQYSYGRRVEVHTDLKPLEMIVIKPLQATPQRLQRMLMPLERYDIQVRYLRGKDMLIADTLSRA